MASLTGAALCHVDVYFAIVTAWIKSDIPSIGGRMVAIRKSSDTPAGIWRARREVKKAIKAQGWHPIGQAGYEALRRQIMNGQTMDWELQ